ncbi:MAG: PAC2 family protein [Chloroflexi bacterium]|nr:PAC2 family protein [Chloroflexota bacterium]
MADQLIILNEKPAAKYLIAGWRRQWSDGGDISSGLSRYLIDSLRAKKIGEMSPEISKLCYPFQMAGTHDAFRPRAAFQDGLPSRPMSRSNDFYDAGNGLILFRGEEPWYRMDLYGEAFFQVVRELGIEQSVAVEGYNGPAPPDLERRIGCVYSKPAMKEWLEQYGLQFSSYGSSTRQGPTIGMALVSMAHYDHPDVEMFRLGAMAPMFPFTNESQQQVGISTDHRSFYDIMRRLRAMFHLDINLLELQSLGDAESRRLQETLERIGGANRDAKKLIDQVRSDYSYVPYEETTGLAPELDRTLRDILDNMPDDLENR